MSTVPPTDNYMVCVPCSEWKSALKAYHHSTAGLTSDPVWRKLMINLSFHCSLNFSLVAQINLWTSSQGTNQMPQVRTHAESLNHSLLVKLAAQLFVFAASC